MYGKVYVPLVAGLGISSMSALHLASDGIGWFDGFELACGVAAMALALYYWRRSRAYRS